MLASANSWHVTLHTRSLVDLGSFYYELLVYVSSITKSLYNGQVTNTEVLTRVWSVWKVQM